MTTVDWNNINGTSNYTLNYFRCPQDPPTLYENVIGIKLAVSIWEALVNLIVLGLIIILTMFGNVLVILSVFTYKPLRTVQNFFIVSLAVADLTVAILVLPLNVAYTLLGRWLFGKLVCTMWLTSDVMCCTASILNLCAIALDRYWAITDPINYAQKRTIRRVMCMIVVVWLLSALICSPPLIGWNDWPDVFDENTPCRLTSQQGYVIYSSLGSFYIPLLIMTTVYIEIFVATRRRLRKRAKASKLNSAKNCISMQNDSVKEQPSPVENDGDRGMASQNARQGTHKEEKRSKSKKKKGKSYREGIAQYTSHSIGEDSINHRLEEMNQPASQTGHQFDNVQPKRSVAVHQFIEEKQRISLSKERRAARTLGIIMGVFVICWLPFFLAYVVLPFCDQCCPSQAFINTITWLGYINSALNPIIYTIFNLDFRTAIKKLLRISQTRDN